MKINFGGTELDIPQEEVERLQKEYGNKLPRTWEELNEVGGYFVSVSSSVFSIGDAAADNLNKNTWPTKEEAEASVALSQLMQLRNAWGGKHLRDRGMGYEVRDMGGEAIRLLIFDTEKTRNDFQETFKDLIEKASPLL